MATWKSPEGALIESEHTATIPAAELPDRIDEAARGPGTAPELHAIGVMTQASLNAASSVGTVIQLRSTSLDFRAESDPTPLSAADKEAVIDLVTGAFPGVDGTWDVEITDGYSSAQKVAAYESPDVTGSRQLVRLRFNQLLAGFNLAPHGFLEPLTWGGALPAGCFIPDSAGNTPAEGCEVRHAAETLLSWSFFRATFGGSCSNASPECPGNLVAPPGLTRWTNTIIGGGLTGADASFATFVSERTGEILQGAGALLCCENYPLSAWFQLGPYPTQWNASTCQMFAMSASSVWVGQAGELVKVYAQPGVF